MKKRLKFSVLPYRESPPKSARWRAYLKTDAWNDWFKFTTMYVLVIFDETGAEHRIGEVKIGQFGMSKQTPEPDLPTSFVLPPEAVDRLRAAAATVLIESPDFQRLLKDVGATIVPAP